jgi:AraC-like DNA-binding protein
MFLNTSKMLIDDIFWQKYNSSPKDPFDIETGPFQEGSEGRQDIHYTLEIGIMLKGRAKRYFSDYSFDVGPGQIWLCGLWEPHGRKTLKNPCERVVISVLPQTLASFCFWPLAEVNLMAPFLVAPSFRPQVAEPDREMMITLGRLIERVHHLGNPDLKNIWYLLLLMEVLLLAMKDWKPPDSCRPQRVADDFLKIGQAIQIVFDSQKRISEKEAAKICRLSQKTFNALFENLMGISFSRFALRYRIYRAARDLLNSTEQIKKIAAQWGFTDSSHFNRCFMEYYGNTPLKFRERFSKTADFRRRKYQNKYISLP